MDEVVKYHVENLWLVIEATNRGRQALAERQERERQAEAAEALRSHLQSTLRNLGQISGLLQGAATTQAASTTTSPRPVRRPRAR